MGNSRKILIIDDDDELRELLSEQLSLHEEFDTMLAANASDGLKLARNGHVDLVLLDVGLPDLDGREACKLLRRSGFKGPVVMLTGQASDADTILGLESGANDYVTKPFKLGVLLARIRAQLRQHEQSEDAVFTIGPYTFKPASKLLVDSGGGKIRLTEKETSILKYLYRAGERVVTRDVLLHEVWGYNAGVTTHTLETHIYRLRQKIEKDPSQAELLITETGGYKLVPVQTLSGAAKQRELCNRMQLPLLGWSRHTAATFVSQNGPQIPEHPVFGLLSRHAFDLQT